MYCGDCGAESTHDLLCPYLLTELVTLLKAKKLSNWHVATFVSLSRDVAAALYDMPELRLTGALLESLNSARTAAQFAAVLSRIGLKERE